MVFSKSFSDFSTELDEILKSLLIEFLISDSVMPNLADLKPSTDAGAFPDTDAVDSTAANAGFTTKQNIKSKAQSQAFIVLFIQNSSCNPDIKRADFMSDKNFWKIEKTEKNNFQISLYKKTIY